MPGSGQLTVVVLEARGLSPALAGDSQAAPPPPQWKEGWGPCARPSATGRPLAHTESFVKVQLILNRKKWKRRKTSARSGTAAPYFNEAFSFPVPLSQVQVGCTGRGRAGCSLARPG